MKMLFLCETLKNISSNYILIKKRKNDYRKPKWMTTKILAALKKSSKTLKKALCKSINDK